MPGIHHPRTVISFGPFEADLQTQELRKQGVRLRLPGQSFQILKILLERPESWSLARSCIRRSGHQRRL